MKKSSAEDAPLSSRQVVPQRRFPVLYIGLLALLIGCGGLLTALFLRHQFRSNLRHEQLLLTRASDDIAHAVHAWVTITTNQTEGLSRFPVVMQTLASRDAAHVNHAREILDSIKDSSAYSGIYLIAENGKQIMATTGAPDLDPATKKQAAACGKVSRITLLVPGRNPGYPQLAFIQPVYRYTGKSVRRVGALVVVTRPDAVQNLVETPAESRVRTLLFARNAQGELVYFSRMTHLVGDKTAIWKDSSADAAMRGEKQFVLRRTPDGLQQYAVSGYLPDLGWGTITREWRKTVLAPFYETALWAIAVYVATCGLLVALACALWRHLQVEALREELKQRQVFENSLRQSQELFNTLFRCAPVGMIMSRASDGCIIEVNDSCLAITGFRREDVLANTTLNLGIWSDPADRARLIEELAKQEIVRNYRFRGRTKLHESAELELTAEVILLHNEMYYLASLQDVTPQVVLQEQLRQAQKLEAIGLLAGTVAHDFNNLLMAISSQAELLMHTNDFDRVRMKAQRILKATDSAAKLTRKLLAFGRKQELASTNFELGGFLTHVCELIGDLLPRNIRMERRVDPAPCWVRTDPGQLEQTIINLVINARDAMPDGGRLVLASEAIGIAAGESLIYDGVPEGNYALLTVADTGCGIPPEHRDRIFEPFFTTKPKERGTGLGLAMVYGIVRQSGGHLRMRSTVGAGTTFSIYLPLVHAPELGLTAATAGMDESALPARSEEIGTILVVDDEELVRDSVRRFLEQAGLAVITCSDGTEALRTALDLQNKLGMLVTDVVMPGMSGTDLAGTLANKQPGLPVVFMSGYAAGDAGNLNFRRAAFLQKPFTRARLLDAVRRVLEL